MKQLLVVVTGGRDYADECRVSTVLSALYPSMLFHGGARGADTLAAGWAAHTTGVSTLRFPAEWRKHGRAAGPMRNKVMLERAKSLEDSFQILVVAFPGGAGTAHCVKKARELGLNVLNGEDSDAVLKVVFDYLALQRGTAAQLA